MRVCRALWMGLASATFIAGATLSPDGAAAQHAPKDGDLVTVPPVPRTYKPARTPWGEPDLRGTWPIDHLNFTPLQRTAAQGNRYWLTDEEYAAREKMLAQRSTQYDTETKSGKMGMGHWVEVGSPNRRTSFLIDPPNGRIPELTPEGKRLSSLMRSDLTPGQTFDWVDDFDSWDRCITRGMPASMFPFNYNNGIRIWQAPGYVVIQLEMVHETRIIPTDGRAPMPATMHNWIGDGRGHWENGNTLVVTSSNFRFGPSALNVGTWGSPPGNVTPVSDKAVMTERFTMTGPDSIVYEVTWNDPVVFAKPWTARLDWKRNDKYQIYEYACHEGDIQIRGYITSSRAQRAKDAAAKQAAGK